MMMYVVGGVGGRDRRGRRGRTWAHISIQHCHVDGHEKDRDGWEESGACRE